jgi:hypothetical protein
MPRFDPLTPTNKFVDILARKNLVLLFDCLLIRRKIGNPGSKSVPLKQFLDFGFLGSGT